MEKVFKYDDGTKEIFLLTYYPVKYQASLYLEPEEFIVSQFLLDFKNGHRPASVLAAKFVADALKRHFDLDKERIILIPIPASNREDSERRYRLFCHLVSQNCNVANGQKWVKNWREGEKKHLTSNHVLQDDQDRWYVNYAKIKNKQVVIFDDLATTGETAFDFSVRLKEAGAKVIGKIFLAATCEIKKEKP